MNVCHEARSTSLAMCHEMSCSACVWGILRGRFGHMAVHSLTAFPACLPASRICLRWLPQRARALPPAPPSVGSEGRLRSFVPPSGLGAGRMSLFRAPSRGRAGGGAGGRIAAARFARVIARARRRTHLARRLPPGSFLRPQPLSCAETPKGGPGSRLSLLSFYTMSPNVKPLPEQKMKCRVISHTRLKSRRKPQVVPSHPGPDPGPWHVMLSRPAQNESRRRGDFPGLFRKLFQAGPRRSLLPRGAHQPPAGSRARRLTGVAR